MTMMSRSRTRPPTRVRPFPSSEILDLIYRGLETALREQCARRYDIPLSLHRLDSSEEEPASSGLRLERRGLIHLVARLTVSYVGGNVYDVRCSIEDGPTCRHSYSLPGNETQRSTQAPQLSATLIRFLLDELERQVGRQRLRRSAILLPARMSRSR